MLQGTIVSMIITMLGEVACLVYAARVFLTESIFNFSVIMLMWITLFYSFLICCNFFGSIVSEVSMVLVVMNQLIFATLPVISAAIISWFLCVEIPSLDLLLCFNTIYFVYMLYVGKPRVISIVTKRIMNKNNSPTIPTSIDKVILPPYILLIMYIIPIIITIFMHIGIHHNVLATTHTRITNFILSIVVPCLLMIFCANKQLTQPEQLNLHSNDLIIFYNLSKILDFITFFLCAGLIYCIESHPIMDEIKSFSDLPNDTAGYAIMGSISLVFIAFGIHRFCQYQMKLLAEQHNDHINLDQLVINIRKKLKYMNILSSICIGCANALFVLVIGLPDHAIGVSIVGAMSLAEYYLHPEWSLSSRIVLISIASLYSVLTSHSFIKMIFSGINYEFNWYINLSLLDFSLLIKILIPLAILLPTLINNNNTTTKAAAANILGLLPGALSTSTVLNPENQYENLLKTSCDMIFAWVFPLFIVMIVGVELMLREQVCSIFILYCIYLYLLYYTYSMYIYVYIIRFVCKLA